MALWAVSIWSKPSVSKGNMWKKGTMRTKIKRVSSIFMIIFLTGIFFSQLVETPKDTSNENRIITETSNNAVDTRWPSAQVNVNGHFNQEPAPMGIADFGIGPSGPYEYATNDSVGIATIESLSTNSSSSFGGMSFQLNVNLAFNTSHEQYVYWIQDMAFISSSGIVTFENNVWNHSAPFANMSASGVSGNGQIFPFQNRSFYAFGAGAYPGNFIPLAYPATITLNMTSSVSSSGEPNVSFAYDDGYGLITYDTVTFTDVTGPTSLTGFVVNGFNYTPTGVYYDSELILGGPGGGLNATDVQSDVQLQLEYWNGHNYEMVPNAYNFGSDTLEGMDNVLSEFSCYPGNGTILAKILPGPGQLGELYNQSQTGIINITSPLTSGTLYITRTSDPNATAWQIPFVSGEVTVTLYPGSYSLQLHNQYGQLFDQGNFTVSAGQILYLQTPLSPATHNIAVINARIVSAKTVVGKGFSDNVTVLVADNGDYAETFNVTAYANSTVIETEQVSLNATDQATLTFTWNTTGFAYGNYTISVYAQPVPGETDNADNNFTIGAVTVIILGDLNGDGKVDLADLVLLADAYGSHCANYHYQGEPASPNWNPNADIAPPYGIISLTDLVTMAMHYGQHNP